MSTAGRRLRAAGCASLLAAALFAGCAREAPGPPPNVLLIVVDTLRADRLGSYGNERGLTPFLDELAGRAIRLDKAYAASSWTRPSVASLLTSRYPSQHGAVTILNKIPDEELTLAEALSRIGYATGAVVGSPIITQEGGCAQGFDWYREFEWRDKIRVPQIRDEASGWLDRVWPSAKKPVFLYLHLMEPHGPYYPPEPYRARFRRGTAPAAKDFAVNRKLMRAWNHFMSRGDLDEFRQFDPDEIDLMESLYDGEVASLDAELRTLFDELARRKFLDNSIVVFTADHGEEFYEHGGTWHGYTLYNETLQVPLLVLAPGAAGGRGVRRNVSLVDVAPTVFDLLHVPAPATFEGRSFAARIRKPPWLDQKLAALKRLWSGDGPPTTLAELEKSGGHFSAVPKHTHALMRRSLKLLTLSGGGTEIYDLARDPGEAAPNPPALADTSGELQEVLRRRRDNIASRARRTGEKFEMDAATKDRLRALGYSPD